MPSPEEIKAIIDSGAYAAGHILCVNGTLPWRLAEGAQPSGKVTRRYIKAATEMEEAAEEMVEDLMKPFDRNQGGAAGL